MEISKMQREALTKLKTNPHLTEREKGIRMIQIQREQAENDKAKK